MKKLLFLTLLLGTLQLCAQAPAAASLPENPTARKVSPEDVPNVITTNFNNRVKGIVPSWTDNGNNYMAAYVDSVKLSHVITYDKNGSLMALQDELTATAYPAPIERYHDRRYPNEKFTVWRNTDASGNKMYYFTRNQETVWFDPLGNPVEKSPNQKVKKP